MKPFSCMEYFHWAANNCDTCVRAFRPKKGKELPDYNATQRLVNLGRECKIKFAIEYAMGTSTDIPDEISALMGAGQCMMHSTDDKDGPPKPKPRKPPEDPMQLMLLSVTDEILNTEAAPVRVLEHA